MSSAPTPVWVLPLKFWKDITFESVARKQFRSAGCESPYKIQRTVECKKITKYKSQIINWQSLLPGCCNIDFKNLIHDLFFLERRGFAEHFLLEKRAIVV